MDYNHKQIEKKWQNYWDEHESFKAKELFEALKAQNIYVRYFNKPRIDEYLRISMGTDEQMDKVITFLKGYLNG